MIGGIVGSTPPASPSLRGEPLSGSLPEIALPPYNVGDWIVVSLHCDLTRGETPIVPERWAIRHNIRSHDAFSQAVVVAWDTRNVLKPSLDFGRTSGTFRVWCVRGADNLKEAVNPCLPF